MKKAPAARTKRESNRLPRINGKKLAAIRQDRGLTQADLCQKARVPGSMLSELERNADRTVLLPAVARIAHALEVTIDELVDWSTLR